MNSPNALFEPSLKRILVVDDEEIVRIALRETLRREHYGVTACSSPRRVSRFSRRRRSRSSSPTIKCRG